MRAVVITNEVGVVTEISRRGRNRVELPGCLRPNTVDGRISYVDGKFVAAPGSDLTDKELADLLAANKRNGV